MTHEEQKDKLEQTYEFHAKEGTIIRETDSLSAFLTGAQTILDNPQEWGLYPNHQDKEWSSTINSVMDDNAMLRAENTRYREALEAITRVFGNPISSRIAKEALKQQDDETDNRIDLA